ncbi:MAG TPA: sigma-54 dependent transcriptional regulator [Polyangiaceae bacterium]|nr:sigma-54 dependent transcriptional regulator [Polyangiaceae bacterium]
MVDTAKILVVDDNAGIRTALSLLLDVHGLTALCVANPEEALCAIREDDIGVVIQDMNYSEDTTGGEEGIRLFRQIHEHDPDLPVLLMTAWTSLETAVQLVKEGAEDYFGKPWDDEKLVNTIVKLLKVRQLRLENRRLRAAGDRARRRLAETFDLCGLVYTSQVMHQVLTLATSVARSDAAVLITGPNGSGKEMIAKIIQANSRRREAPFVTVNAGGLPDELLEAELFGAEPGAYTGAKTRREGRFEAAHAGTLFLDEIGNLSAKGQMKLLRVLQTGEFERLGSNRTQKVDVRILSATNADLRDEITRGTFREDLYFRLAVIEIHVPPLRERPEDILPIAEWLLPRFPGPNGVVRELSAASREALVAHDWPGNVRELQNKIQRANLVAEGPFLEPHDLDLDSNQPESQWSEPDQKPTTRVERNADAEEIEEALERARGVISRAAAELGMSRQALYRRMARAGISVERRTTAKEP